MLNLNQAAPDASGQYYYMTGFHGQVKGQIWWILKTMLKYSPKDNNSHRTEVGSTQTQRGCQEC